MRRETYDYRRAPWMPSTSRHETFERLADLAKQGMTQRQMAERLGTTRQAINCYCYRYGITMAELRGEE